MQKIKNTGLLTLLLTVGWLLMSAGPSAAQFGNSSSLWVQVFGGPEYDKLTAIAESPDGGMILAGSSSSYGSGPINPYLIKTDSTGSVQWQRVIDNVLWIEINSIIVDENTYLLAGASKRDPTAQYNMFVIKTDLEGNVLWTSEIGGQQNDVCTSIIPDGEGGFFLTGFSESGGLGYNDMAMAKINSDGDVLWSRYWGGENNDFSMNAVRYDDNSLVLAGSTFSFDSDYQDIYVVKTDFSGNQIWEKIIGYPGPDYINSVQTVSDGGLVLCGTTYPYAESETTNLLLLRLDSAGDTLWSRTFGGDRWAEGTGVVQTPDGGFLCSGFIISQQTDDADFYLVRTNSTGDSLWTQTFGRNGWDRAYGIKLFGDGGFAIVGQTSSFNAEKTDFYFLRFANWSPLNLFSPADGETVFQTDPVLQWGLDVDTSAYLSVVYDVWLDTLESFATSRLVGSDIAPQNLQLNGLQDGQTYYWRVRGKDTLTGSWWSGETFSFMVFRPDPPLPFNLVAPPDEAVVFNDTVTVRWDAAVDPDPGDSLNYIIEWSLDSLFTVFSTATIADTFFTITDIEEMLHGRAPHPGLLPVNRGRAAALRSNSPRVAVAPISMKPGMGDGDPESLDELPDDSIIYWRVRAVDSYDIETWSTSGETGWAFHIYLAEPPEEFSLISPEDGETINAPNTPLLWQSADDPDPDDLVTGYAVWWATDEAYSQNLDSVLVDTAFVELNGLTDNRTFWWKVRAIDENSPGRWSAESWSFNVDIPDPPSPFSLLLPADGDTLSAETASRLAFVWESSVDPDSGEFVSYALTIKVTQQQDQHPLTLQLSERADTSATINLPDSLDLQSWEEALAVEWSVAAVSGPDTVDSNTMFHFTIEPNSAVNPGDYSGIPTQYAIAGLFPNPFNPTATAVIGLPDKARLNIALYNILGKEVAVIANDVFSRGYHSFTLRAENLPSGIYFVRAVVPGRMNEIRKVVLLR